MTLLSSIENTVHSPFPEKWTVLDLLEWLAADDRRCHDPRLTELLAAIDDACAGGTAPEGLSPQPIALVRSIAAAVRTRPELRGARIDEILRDGTCGAALAPRPPGASGRPLGSRLDR